jgi:hypothetical protein
LAQTRFVASGDIGILVDGVSDGLTPVVKLFDLLVPNQPFFSALDSRQTGNASVKFADGTMVAPPRPYRVGIYTFLSPGTLSRYWDIGV